MTIYTIVGVYRDTGKAYVDTFVTDLPLKQFAVLLGEQREELEILAAFSGDLEPVYLN